MFSNDALTRVPLTMQFRQILCSAIPLPTPDVADLVPFYLLDDIALKQELLAGREVSVRVARTADALEELIARLPHSSPHIPARETNFSLRDPEMN